MGFDALFYARLDYGDKERRLNDLEMEYVWRPNKDSLGNDVQILTHALFDHYCTPGGFDFSIFSNDDPVVANRDSQDFNADRRARDFLNNVDQRA